MIMPIGQKKSTTIQANKLRMSNISEGVGHHQQARTKQATTATHFLKSQGQASSAKPQKKKAPQLLTN